MPMTDNLCRGIHYLEEGCTFTPTEYVYVRFLNMMLQYRGSLMSFLGRMHPSDVLVMLLES